MDEDELVQDKADHLFRRALVWGVVTLFLWVVTILSAWLVPHSWWGLSLKASLVTMGLGMISFIRSVHEDNKVFNS